MLGWLWTWLSSLFWSRKLEIAVVGVQGAGKTSLVNVLTEGSFQEHVAPTVGFNLRKVKKGSVELSLWDLSGQPRFRALWTRYATGVSTLLFVVDAADAASFDVAREELHALLRELPRVAVLVLGNKNDLAGCVPSREVIKQLELVRIKDREVDWFSISAKSRDNIDAVIRWLEKRA